MILSTPFLAVPTTSSKIKGRFEPPYVGSYNFKQALRPAEAAAEFRVERRARRGWPVRNTASVRCFAVQSKANYGTDPVRMADKSVELCILESVILAVSKDAG